jgi:HSP20 family protein
MRRQSGAVHELAMQARSDGIYNRNCKFNQTEDRSLGRLPRAKLEGVTDMLLSSFDPFAEFHRALRVTDGGHAAMRMDAIRREGEIELRFDLPGIDTQSIDVTVDRGVLNVSARRSEEYAEDEKPFVRERVMGSFTRRLRLSDSVDAEQIQAAYDGGVLTVRVPLAERALPRKIEVSTQERAAVSA